MFIPFTLTGGVTHILLTQSVYMLFKTLNITCIPIASTICV